MTKRETVSLMIKLVGVYFIVQFFPTLSYILRFMSAMNQHDPSGNAAASFRYMTASPALWIGVGLLAIRLSDRIAKLLVSEDTDASSSSGLYGPLGIPDTNQLLKISRSGPTCSPTLPSLSWDWFYSFLPRDWQICGKKCSL